MLYPEDLELSEQARVAGLEAFSANAGDKATPHIIQRFVNIYDHLATTLFDRKILSSLYPAQSGERFTIQQLTHAQKKFRDHVDRYGYMNMSACPVPSVVGLKTSLLDYSIALSNYTDFGIRVEKGLDQTYRLLAEILNADDALSSLSTTSRLTGIDTHLKYRARYNADMQKNIGETQATTEIPYGKLVRSNKEMIQTFDHRNGFEKTLDEKTKNNIENLVSKIAMLMNNVANDVASSDAAVNGRVVSALSNLLFEVGQMTRDYGTYLFRINAFIGVVDGVIAEATNFTPEHVKRAVEEAEAVAGNNGFEMAQYDAGLNAFNTGALGKLLIGVIVAIIGAIVALVAFNKKHDGDGKGSAITSLAREIKEELEKEPQKKVIEAARSKPEVVSAAIKLANSGGATLIPAPPSQSTSSAPKTSVDEQPSKIAHFLEKLEKIWILCHNLNDHREGPTFNAKTWLSKPIMPYEVRSFWLDCQMSVCLWYKGDFKYAKELEQRHRKLVDKLDEEVSTYKRKYGEFTKLVATGELIPTDVVSISEYAQVKMGEDAEACREEVERQYPTTSFTMGKATDPLITARREKYSREGADLIDAQTLEDYVELSFNERQYTSSRLDILRNQLNKIGDEARKALREVERNTANDPKLISNYMEHIKALRKYGVALSDLTSALNAYVVRTTAAESSVLVMLTNYHDFAVTMNKLQVELNK